MRHDMNDVKQALKLYYKEGISIRKAAVAAGIPRSTVSDYVKRIDSSGLSPNEALDLSFSDLKDKLVPYKPKPPARTLPDPAYIAEEIKKPGVTYLLLWQEYIENNPLGYKNNKNILSFLDRIEFNFWVKLIFIILLLMYRFF